MADIVARLKELMNLPPEERIRKLKEIAELNKKEIEEAQQLLHQSEEELVEEEQEKEKEDIPIPQLRAADIDALVGEEEKQIFATKRYADARKKKTEDKDEKPQLAFDKNLEETVAVAPESLRMHAEDQKLYQGQAATMPARDLYSAANQLMEEFKEQINDRGYLTDQQRQGLGMMARDIAYAARDKNQAMHEGAYKANQRTEEIIRNTAELSKRIMDYVRG